jgi:hypothetical protein
MNQRPIGVMMGPASSSKAVATVDAAVPAGARLGYLQSRLCVRLGSDSVCVALESVTLVAAMSPMARRS